MKRITLLLLCGSIVFTGIAFAQGARGWTDSTSAPILASPKLADLTGDGVAEILLTTYGIVNPYGEGLLYAWDGAGNQLSGFPILMSGAAPGTPAVGDLDGNGTMEIVQGTWKNLYVFNADGTNYPGWPISSYITQAASLADLDGNGDLEIIVPNSNSLYVYNHDGTTFPGFPVTGANDLTSAAVGDLDGDGDLELVSGSFVASGSPSDFVYAWHHDGTAVTGFPVTTVGSVKAAPALADLDGDGTMEVMADCWNKSGTDEFYVWDHTGVLEPGWPKSIPYIRLSSPSVADLDLNGDLEIVFGGWQNTPPVSEVVHAYHHDGTVVTGFPVNLNNSPSGNVNSTPTTGNIDADPNPEIVLKAVNNIYALNHDGTIVSGFPVFIDDTSHSGTTSPSPAIGDPDGDGLVEIFAASTFDTVMLIDQADAYSKVGMYWPTFGNEPENGFTYTITPLIIEPDFISGSSGGTAVLYLNAGLANAGRNYIVLGSVSGTNPGTPLPGGFVILPLNWDIFTAVVINLLNTPVFQNFLGVLDGAGKAQAQFTVPPGTVPFGGVYFAFALNNPWDFVSNPATVTIGP